MKLLAKVFAIGLLVLHASAFGGPIYRAGEKVSTARSVWHGELSAGYVFSSHKLEYATEEDSSSRLRGAEARALWAPLSWLAVGAEFGKLGGEKFLPVVESDSGRRWAGILRLPLAPNTAPRVYLVGGFGRSEHKLTYDHSYFPVRKYPPVTVGMNFWTAGLGIEADVWKGIFVGVEGNVVYYSKGQLSEIFKMSSRTETNLRVRGGVRF